MDFTSINEISKGYLGSFYSQSIVAGKTNSVSFQTVLDENMREQGLEDMLKAKYPGLKYHVLDTSKINSSLWQRNDYPFEMFFEDNLSKSVLDWKPTSENPSMLDAGVQARLNAARGKYAIVVPPALEKKLENNPKLSQDIMNKISALIKEQDSVPSCMDSFNITLDEEGNISNYRLSGGGGEITITRRNGRKNRDEEIEEVLKVKYPQLIYHVCDASKFTYWNRLDFPFSEVFKEKMDENKLKNWRPVTPYATGYEEYVQRDRLSIPQGAYSVIIHPDVQKKMETDSVYAQKIFDKIDKHFQDTIRINEAIDPGCTIGMKQAVYIDENGEIGHQVSITNGPDYYLGEKDNTIGEVYNKLPQNKKKASNQKVVDNMVQNIVQNTTAHSSNYTDLLSFNGLGIIPYTIDKKKE